MPSSSSLTTSSTRLISFFMASHRPLLGHDAGFAPARMRRLSLGGAGPAGVEHVADKPVVDQGSDHASQQGTDDRDPEVVAELEASRVVGAGEGGLPPAEDPGHDARPEVTRGVDGVPGVGSE